MTLSLLLIFKKSLQFCICHFNPIQDGLFQCCSHLLLHLLTDLLTVLLSDFNPAQDGQKASPPSLKSVTHILQWWNLAELYFTQRRSKNYMNYVTLTLSPWALLPSAFFHRKWANFALSRNTDIDWILIHNFYLV